MLWWIFSLAYLIIHKNFRDDFAKGVWHVSRSKILRMSKPTIVAQSLHEGGFNVALWVSE